jgi:thioredoxin reductase (NADPH)
VEEIRLDAVVGRGPKGRDEVPADVVYLMTGYHPDPSLFAGAGVRVDPETLAPTHDPQTLETNVPGFYLAGSVVSGKNTGRIFIENGRFHGEAIVKSILSARR